MCKHGEKKKNKKKKTALFFSNTGEVIVRVRRPRTARLVALPPACRTRNKSCFLYTEAPHAGGIQGVGGVLRVAHNMNGEN